VVGLEELLHVDLLVMLTVLFVGGDVHDRSHRFHRWAVWLLLCSAGEGCPTNPRPTWGSIIALVWTALIGRRLAWGGTAALAVAIVASTSGCGLCGNADFREYPSPDRAMKVVVFTRDCGATTDFSTQLSVLRGADSMPGGIGNAFVADSNHGQASTAVDVRWLDARTVEVYHSAHARVFKAETSVGGIRIVHNAR